MNDIIKQCNKHAGELKPLRHQRALKMVMLKALQVQNSKRRGENSDSFLSFFSMSFTKTLAVGVGITVIAIAVVVGWNPILQRLGFNNSKTTQASAQELLKLTREQYNGLTNEERKRLAESAQGNLEQIWQEAEQAKDLRFLQGSELQKLTMEDTQRALGFELPSSTVKMVEEMEKDLSNKMKQSAFRYTDPQGKITYINLSTYETLPKGLVLTSKTDISVVKLSATRPKVGLEERMKAEYTPERMKELERKAQEMTQRITPEFRQKVQEMMEKRLQKYYPEVFSKWQKAKNQEINMHSLLDSDVLKEDPLKSKFYIIPDEKREVLRNNSEATIYEVDVNRSVKFETQYMVNAYFTDEQDKTYLIMDVFDSAKPDTIENSLFIQREK